MVNEVMYSGVGKSHQFPLNPHRTFSYSHVDDCLNLDLKVQEVLMWLWLLHLSLRSSTLRVSPLTHSLKSACNSPITLTWSLRYLYNYGCGRGHKRCRPAHSCCLPKEVPEVPEEVGCNGQIKGVCQYGESGSLR